MLSVKMEAYFEKTLRFQERCIDIVFVTLLDRNTAVFTLYYDCMRKN